jgi:DNA processing protein
MQGMLKVGDCGYPSFLKLIPDPPKELFWKGCLDEGLFENCLAVVGSRKMSPYGERVVEHFFSELSPKITIVSGFMYGVDAKAHNEALKRNLKTIAVLPCGLDFVYPKEHVSLYKSIEDSGGLILSEYAGSTGPRTWTYLRRNRIVAGLSKALLVVEASEKSGSLNTAELALLYNRDLLAVPGNIFSDVSKGCLQLIKKGAKPVSSGCEINHLMGLSSTGLFVDNNLSTPEVSKTNTIIKTLRAYPLTLDDLSTFMAIPIPILSSKITQLSLEGLIIENQGKLYAR